MYVAYENGFNMGEKMTDVNKYSQKTMYIIPRHF